MGRLRLSTSTSLRAVVAAVSLCAAGAAQAHTPYLLPNVFSVTERDHVTLQGSFTELFFVPEVAMKAEDWHALKPDGAREKLDAVTYFKDLTVIEAPLAGPGTYRFSTGQRFGRKGRMARVGDTWEMMGEPAPGARPMMPEGAKEVVGVQSVTRSDVYVTRGRPTPGALAAVGTGLEIRPVTHPSEIYVDQGFAFELLYEGKPLGGQKLALFRQGQDGDKPGAEVTTDKAGRAEVKVTQPGAYILLTRHRDRAPAGAETPYRSHSYTLTFEVTK